MILKKNYLKFFLSSFLSVLIIILSFSSENWNNFWSLKKEDLIFKHSKYIKYANVVFDKKIYKKRDFIINYLKNRKISLIGRFGKWDYLWSDQAFMTGKAIADEINVKIKNKLS